MDRRSFLGRTFASITAAIATKGVLEARPVAPIDTPQPAPMLPPAPIPPAQASQALEKLLADREASMAAVYSAPYESGAYLDPSSLSYDDYKAYRGLLAPTPEMRFLTQRVAYWFIRTSDERLLKWTLHEHCSLPGQGPLTDRCAVVETVTKYSEIRHPDELEYLAERIGARLLYEVDRKGFEHMGVQAILNRAEAAAVVTHRESGVSIRGMKDYDIQRDVRVYRFDVVVG